MEEILSMNNYDINHLKENSKLIAALVSENITSWEDLLKRSSHQLKILNENKWVLSGVNISLP